MKRTFDITQMNFATLMRGAFDRAQILEMMK